MADDQQLETVSSSLQGDPTNSELIALKTELDEAISVTEAAISDLKPAVAPQKPSAPAVKEKWSKENHPAFQPGYRRSGAQAEPVEEPQIPTTLKVNDMVLAKWVNGDKAFYPARITSITGSSAAPIYTVVFKNYDTSETLRGNDVKPISTDSKKRKADGSPAAPISSVVPGNTNVISAAANINPELASQARKEPSKVSDGPARPAKVPKTIKANKELEAGKNKWQAFSSKGKTSKVPKKESMFRTGEGVTARGELFSTSGFLCTGS